MCDYQCTCCPKYGGNFGELSVGDLSGLFASTVTNPTNNPSVSFSFEQQAPYTVLARGFGTGNPSFQTLTTSHIPGLPASKIISGVFDPERLGTGLPTSTTILYGDGTWGPIPTITGNFITADTNQTGLTGDKTTSGEWTFSSLAGTGTRLGGVDPSGKLKTINIGGLLSYESLSNTLMVTIPTLRVFYVDGNNTNSGDGSVLNPFNTLQQAIDYVIGSGTRESPQYINASIKVASYTYVFTGNLFIQGVSWDFDEGTIINYTGGNYIIDTTPASTMPTPFKIIGYPIINISNGGFIYNEGVNTSTPYNRYIYAEIDYLTSSMALGTGYLDTPVIRLAKIGIGGGYRPPEIVLNLRRGIHSSHKAVFYVTGCPKLSVYGESLLTRIDVGQAGLTQGVIVKWVGDNTDTDQRAYSGGLFIQNLTLGGGGNMNMIEFEGQYGVNTGLYNVNFSPSYGDATVDSLIVFGNIKPGRYNPGSPYCEFVITRCTVVTDLIVNSIDVIQWNGTIPGNNKVTIYNNKFLQGQRIDPNIDFTSSSASYNIINNQVNIRGLSIYADNTAALAGGLSIGDTYRTATGDIKVVY